MILYGGYVREHLRAEGGGSVLDLEPLRLHRLDAGRTAAQDGGPRLRVINVQVLIALACIVGGAFVFVGAVARVSATLGVSGVLLALVIAPIATELPEKLNSVLWVRQSKDTLAMGNITGAMVFQSMIPTVIALTLAPSLWSVSAAPPLVFASAGIAFASTIAIFGPMRLRGVLRGRWLLVGGAFYVAYLLAVVLATAATGSAAG